MKIKTFSRREKVKRPIINWEKVSPTHLISLI